MPIRRIAPLALVAAALVLPTAADAAPVELVELGEDGEVAAEEEAPDPSMERPWIRRWTPRRNMWELGIFGGLWIPADDIELRDRNLPPVRYDLSAELGLRAGYYPLRHFGIEGELAMIPARLQTEQRAFVSTARAGAVLQLGLFRIVPFAVLGGGVISVRSEDNAAGRNGDEMLYVGGGLKYFVNEHIVIRLEGRDLMSPKEGRTPAAPAHTGEVLLGFSLALGPRKPKEQAPPPDADGDGFADADDACVDEPGIAPDGCPAADADSDGFLDSEDTCPEQAGAAPDGCPIPDTDGDGFLDPDDACADEAGVEPDGCPIRDVDGDGLFPPDDQCPQEPETDNGFEDDDGCPDEIPEEVKKYTGVIEGIFFDTGKASIRDKSFPALDDAVKVLTDYPSLRVEISGHTDSKGKRDKNLTLSQERAEAVKEYMVNKGVDAGRISTRGAGPDEPVGDNKTKAGRQQNRRIEFKLITARVGGRAAAAKGGEPASAEPEATEPEAAADPS
ncbi:MAG: OmpA family protein [Nannocystaceae bacterium]